MDSIFEKAGVYDLFGVFLTGAIITTIADLLNIFSFGIRHQGIESIALVQFILASYLVGLILQELASLVDRKLFHIREKAKSNFLNLNNAVIQNPLELESYRKLAFKLLNESASNRDFTSNECISIFYHCKSYLEITEKNGKESKIDSLYAMSRSLSFAFFIMGIFMLFSSRVDLNMALLFLSSLLFFFRASRYASYRVRVILRQYHLAQILQQTNCSSTD